MVGLILSISLPILIFGASFGIFIGILMFEKRKGSAAKGTVLFELDIYNRRIKLYNRISNNNINKSIFNHEASENWVSLSEMTKNFDGTAGERKLRNAFVQALKQKEVNFNFYTDQIVKNKKIFFKVTINKISEIDSHILKLSWDWITPSISTNIKRKNLSKLDVSGDPSMYKGFLAFSLNSQIPNIEELFVKRISTILRFRSPEMFFDTGMVCIPFFGDNIKNVKKKMNYYIKLIENRGFKIGLNRMTFGSSQIVAKEVNTPKRVNVVLRTLDYLTNLSLRKKINFITKDSEYFSEKEYELFVEASHVFRLALRTGDVESKSIMVRRYKSKRKIVEYIIPIIKKIDSDVLYNILKNPYNRSKLIDTHARNISIEKKNLNPALFDVNAEWILNNKPKIKFKESIYVVNFPDTVTGEQIDAIMSLKKKGFIFALRVKGYNEQVATLIMNIKPQFVVIDEELASVASPRSYIQLVSIKKIANLAGTKIIFENPSQHIDKEWSDKINLDFYYEF